MITINDFIEKGVMITWTVLKIGFDGSTQYYKQLSGKDIINYSINKIENGDETLEVLLLASTNESCDGEISKLLQVLSNAENTSIDIELRKWRAIYVYSYLLEIQDDYIQGLVELGDIWAKLDFPNDSPHVFQGRKNKITPEEYYTQENYKKLLEIHKKWLEEEIIDLRKSDGQNNIGETDSN